MGAIANLFGYLLNFLYNLFNNYGIAIIVFTILLRIILIPITVSQQKSMKKNAKVQEKMKEIQKKYKNNPEKLNQETIELYKREKVSPFSGCLSSIIQIILIISVFWLVSKPLTYMKKVDSNKVNEYIEQIKTEDGKASAYPEIQIIQTKSAEDSEVAINMDFLGLDLSKVPNQNLKDIKVYIIPILYVITSFVSIKMTNNMQDKAKEKKKAEQQKKATENNEISEEKALISEEEAKSEEAMEAMQDMTKSMNYMIPIMSITIAFIAPLGLALYWLVSNIAMIIERIIINKISENKKEEEENA
ncbi:MAG: YidC/Oxa1 family membrane protein insertase [Clostridium sp.]|nr:YidC/Oxa1 family membrane protein insertase [Clostridium sp.]CCZ18028.1 membrane protein insertase YidC/Oxa1 family [Clostridium sp. CAG:780]